MNPGQMELMECFEGRGCSDGARRRAEWGAEVQRSLTAPEAAPWPALADSTVDGEVVLREVISPGGNFPRSA